MSFDIIICRNKTCLLVRHEYCEFFILASSANHIINNLVELELLNQPKFSVQPTIQVVLLPQTSQIKHLATPKTSISDQPK
uniref:Uncharacterized protein n=1 Tax=Rhizophora mucronata TaxID=61149 RepID=A0A2P2PGD9_RHIMU